MSIKEGLPLLAVSVLGLISIVVPVFFLEDLKPYDSPLFPLIKTGIEGVSWFSFLFLFLSGFVVKLFSIHSSWKIGIISMALFPLAAICEMIVDSSSHTMFPIEFIFYLIYSIPAIMGAYAAQFLKKLVLVKAVKTS